MLLIRERFPEVYARTYKFLNVLDYLNLRLTGRYAATFDSILTSWVTDNRDPDSIHYARELVAACGVDGDKLPEILPCTAVLGTLKAEVAATLGLAPDVQVVAGRSTPARQPWARALWKIIYRTFILAHPPG